MDNKSVAIIGVGSLGGFLAESVALVDTVSNLTLIDPDIVEAGNIKNSIYTVGDIGTLKVESIAEKIGEKIDGHRKKLDLNIRAIKYNENINLSGHDIVFDCRDQVCSRSQTINVRLYISWSKLVVDCRHHVEIERERSGRYIESLNQVAILMGALRVALLIPSGKLEELIKRRMSYEIDLQRDHETEACLQREDERDDYICDFIQGHQKIINLDNMLPQIIEETKKSDVEVYIGPKRAYHTKRILNQDIHADQRYIIAYLTDLVNRTVLKYNSYTISISMDYKDGGVPVIELHPETGGA